MDIGDNVSIGYRSYILASMRVVIEDGCHIGPDVKILAESKDLASGINQGPHKQTKGIRIGKNCLVGGGVTILDHVSIGANCVLGVGTIVSKDVPPYSVVVGNPGRVTKSLMKIDD